MKVNEGFLQREGALSRFENRCRDQKWMIADTSRRYGLSFDGHDLHEVGLPAELIVEWEKGVALPELYRRLWKQYFDSVNIPQRENMELHIKKVPRRYWRYLPEKTVTFP